MIIYVNVSTTKIYMNRVLQRMPKKAFTVTGASREENVLPFGMSLSPSTCKCHTEMFTRALQSKVWLINLDNFIFFGCTVEKP